VQSQLTPTQWPEPDTWGWKLLGQPSQAVQIHSFGVGRNHDGRLEVFALGKDGNLWQMWQVDSHVNWSSWKSLGSPREGLSLEGDWDRPEPPSVATNQDGRQEVNTLARDGAIWHIAQTTPNNGWDRWESLGKPISLETTHTQVLI
jgi:hypothetical protein